MDCARQAATPIGILTVFSDTSVIKRVSFDAYPEHQRDLPLLVSACMQLEEYFSGQRTAFDLPLDPGGTAFQQKVYALLCAIPYGQTCTYSSLSSQLQMKNGARAVGMACHHNPLPIFIPCHRVVGKKGLTGYAGGLDKKEFLLHLEGVL